MSEFLTEWGLAILISLAVLGVLIWAEWRDHRDGLYDDDTDPPTERETYDPEHSHSDHSGPYVSAFGPIGAPVAHVGEHLGTGWHLEPHELTHKDPADR